MATPTRTHRLRRGVLTAVVVAVLALEVAAVAPTLTASLSRLGHADPLWIAAAVAAAATSMSFFARTRRRLLAATGIRVPQRDALAAVYVANALHVTLPGGAAFSTTWTYRWMRARGASAPAITWTRLRTCRETTCGAWAHPSFYSQRELSCSATPAGQRR